MTKEERLTQINEEMEVLTNDPIFNNADVMNDEEWAKFEKVNEQLHSLTQEMLGILNEILEEVERERI